MKDEVIGFETESRALNLSSLILPPSSFPSVPLAVPFWNRQTYKNIIQCLISCRVSEGPQLQALRLRIVEALGVANVLLCGSGSLALEFALRTCGVRRGDEVILPTFCCPSVVAPILAAGATPVLADVGRELNLTAASVKAALTQKTRAVIVPHLFGNPAAIEEIVESVRGKNICVVDDAAQALGATIAGRPVGGFGDAGILSFGAEKVCFGLGGGVLLSRNRDIDDPFTRSDWPASALGPALKNLCATFFLRRLRRWTRPIDSRWSAKSPDESPQQYRREAMSNLAAAVAGSLIDSLQENLTARRARVELYRELLRECRGLQLIPHRAGSACLSQVIRVSPRRCSEDAAAKLIDMLRTSGYEVQGSYVPIHLLANFGQCVWDRLPHAERVWADLVELPCEPGVSLADVERIAEILRGHVGD